MRPLVVIHAATSSSCVERPHPGRMRTVLLLALHRCAVLSIGAGTLGASPGMTPRALARIPPVILVVFSGQDSYVAAGDAVADQITSGGINRFAVSHWCVVRRCRSY